MWDAGVWVEGVFDLPADDVALAVDAVCVDVLQDVDAVPGSGGDGTCMRSWISTPCSYNEHHPHWARNLRPPGCDDITMTKVTEVATARMEAVILSRRIFLLTGRACGKVLRGRR